MTAGKKTEGPRPRGPKFRTPGTASLRGAEGGGPASPRVVSQVVEVTDAGPTLCFLWRERRLRGWTADG